MNVILYTTHCPKCSILEKKLNEKNISFDERTDVDEMLNKGFDEVPVLDVNGKIMRFKEANTWVNEQ